VLREKLVRRVLKVIRGILVLKDLKDPKGIKVR
jgi:hypothetical protein